jgi:hypothetical protein
VRPYITFGSAKDILEQVGISFERYAARGCWIYSLTFPDGHCYDTYGSPEDANQSSLDSLIRLGLGVVAGITEGEELFRGVSRPYEPVFDGEQRSLAMRLFIEYVEEKVEA